VYELTVRKSFAAAHRLQGFQGGCEQMHGHTWSAEVSVAGKELNEYGILIDFHELQDVIGRIILDLDHRYLNDLSYFNEPGREINPTAENIARYIYLRLKENLDRRIRLMKVVVWEAPDAWASYYEEED